MKKVTLRVVLSVGLSILGFGLLAYPTMTEVTSKRFQATLAQYDSSQDAITTSGNNELPTDVFAKMIIPDIDVETFVLEGTTQPVLKKGPGHYPETPLPGQQGNSAIAGHRTMYGHPFRDLDKLDAGSEILIQTEEGSFKYEVVRKEVVAPTNVSVIGETDGYMLTLTTCHPVGSARQRLVVSAELVEESS